VLSPVSDEDTMKKTLIVYHSRSGYTRRVAQALAKRLNADLDEIRIMQHLGGALGYAMCAVEAIAGLAPALRPSHRDPAAHELVVVGTPIWFWSLASPVRSWLERHALKRRVAFFCTMGGSGAQRVFSTMAELSGKEPVATLALIDKEIDGAFEDKLDAFVQRLQSGMHRRPARTAAPVSGLHAAV
jgi:flavodoxin